MKVKAFFSSHPELWRLAGAVFLIWMGAYLAVPGHGFLATLPLFVPFALGAAFLDGRAKLLLPLSFAAGFFFEGALEGQEGRWQRAAAFALFLLLITLLCLSAKWLFSRKKAGLTVLGVLLIASSAAFHLLWNGTPWDQTAHAGKLRDYLSARYPAAAFSDTVTFLDRKTGEWVSFARFDLDGNEMEAELRETADGFSDGYFSFLAERYADKRRSELLGVLHEGFPLSFRVDSARLSAGALTLSPLKSRPGAWDDAELEPYLVFSVTLEDQTKKREFNDAAALLHRYLAEKGVSYGSLSILGAEGGQGRFSVLLTPDTPEEEIPYRSESLLKENPLQE